MVKRIRNSLSIKVFLWIAGLLVLCSVLIYGIVMIFLPRSYTVVASSRVEQEIQQLTETLGKTKYEEAAGIIEQFCQSNQAMVILNGNETNRSFGTVDQKSVDQGKALTTTVEVNLAGESGVYYLSITAPVSADREFTMAFAELLPLLLILILLIASAGAFLCSRILVRPVLEISRISKRMSQLDMTWECRINRTDELGILASSLNTMAKKLDAAMKDLELANKRLREEMEHITKLSQQRRDFFAAASHELKTPLTILKGQIESMIIGIGRYKDTGKILPDTLKEAENMERLVKEILAISKIEMEGLADKEVQISLSDMADRVMEALRPLAEEKRITVRSEIAGGVTASGSSSLLEKAVHNIISNAIRHSPEGAEVTVRLTGGAFAVTNTGVEIPEEEIPELFLPFYRVEKSRNKTTGGSGLGLYLVKTILELHQFRYKIENTISGVMFTVEFRSDPQI